MFLEKLAAEHNNIMAYYAAAASLNGEIILNLHEHLDGSSIMKETDGESANGYPRKVESITLDSLLEKYNKIEGPYLIKIDVQGAELEVLKGAEKTLKSTDYILMEISFFRFFKSSPQFCEVIEFMNKRGFVPYDLTGLRYRPFDNALAQVDIAFVKEDGIFRKHHNYATAEQRKRMIEYFKKKFRSKIR
jgi:FkbM family methyltransferase